MPKVRYVNQRFSAKVLALVNRANEIIAEYQAQGFTLTLRQLYYQFVARGIIPNKQKEYKRLGDSISKARLAGLVDWLSLEDRTRFLRGLSHWGSPADILDSTVAHYRIDKWATQKRRVEVWIEKDALTGVIEGVCVENDVPYFSCRGYTSQSEMWVASQRLQAHARNGQEPLILHFGDHDPSGIDMTRDIEDRQLVFMGGVEIRRLALNMDQVRKYSPPPNPAKETDSRCNGYTLQYGNDCWELDALEPSLIANLIQKEIDKVRDKKAWAKAMKREEKERERLDEIAAGERT